MPNIHLAIVGCGGMGHRHLAGLAELYSIGLDHFDLVGVCDPISENAENASLIIGDSRIPLPNKTVLKIGHLDPIEEILGQKARLQNLGYPIDVQEKDKVKFEIAIQEFQCDHGLSVSCECDQKTQDKLSEVYGC